jgi:hypothetical protein
MKYTQALESAALISAYSLNKQAGVYDPRMFDYGASFNKLSSVGALRAAATIHEYQMAKEAGPLNLGLRLAGSAVRGTGHFMQTKMPRIFGGGKARNSIGNMLAHRGKRMQMAAKSPANTARGSNVIVPRPADSQIALPGPGAPGTQLAIVPGKPGYGTSGGAADAAQNWLKTHPEAARMMAYGGGGAALGGGGYAMGSRNAKNQMLEVSEELPFMARLRYLMDPSMFRSYSSQL